MLEYRLQREDYWMKTLHTVFYDALNERTKFMNKRFPKRKVFPQFVRYDEHFIDNRTRS